MQEPYVKELCESVACVHEIVRDNVVCERVVRARVCAKQCSVSRVVRNKGV